MNEETRGRSVVMQPGAGPSWWQPVPANGHADPVLFPANTGFDGLSTGFQTVAVGGRVREHSHGEQVEIQICFREKAMVNVDGARHDIVPGSAAFLGCDVKHEIVNDGDEELVMLWIHLRRLDSRTSSRLSDASAAGTTRRRSRSPGQRTSWRSNDRSV